MVKFLVFLGDLSPVMPHVGLFSCIGGAEPQPPSRGVLPEIFKDPFLLGKLFFAEHLFVTVFFVACHHLRISQNKTFSVVSCRVVRTRRKGRVDAALCTT